MEQSRQREWTDAEILEALRRGGIWTDRAWEYMVKKWKGIYYQAIRENAHVAFVDDYDVDEAIQEMAPGFVNTVTKPGWPGLRNKLSTYFAQSVYYEWLRICRKRSRVILPGDENLPAPGDDGTGGEDAPYELLDSALRRLDERCRELLRLDYWERYKNEEIAQMQGIGVQAVKNNLTKCRKRLKSLLEKLFNLTGKSNNP